MSLFVTWTTESSLTIRGQSHVTFYFQTLLTYCRLLLLYLAAAIIHSLSLSLFLFWNKMQLKFTWS